jgi:hypothetical protein
VTDKTKCYYFRVKSYDYSDTPAECEDAQSYCYVPAAANLKATSSELAKAKITWNAINSISEYKLEYKKLSSSSYTTKTVKVNSYELTGLTCGESYDIRVTPINSDAVYCGTAETTVTVKTLSAPQNVEVEDFEMTKGSYTWQYYINGTVCWDAVDGADYYTIQIRNAADSTWTDYKSYGSSYYATVMKVTGTSVTLSQSDYSSNYIYISSSLLPATVELRVVAHNTEHSVTVESTALEGTVTE